GGGVLRPVHTRAWGQPRSAGRLARALLPAAAAEDGEVPRRTRPPGAARGGPPAAAHRARGPRAEDAATVARPDARSAPVFHHARAHGVRAVGARPLAAARARAGGLARPRPDGRTGRRASGLPALPAAAQLTRQP